MVLSCLDFFVKNGIYTFDVIYERKFHQQNGYFLGYFIKSLRGYHPAQGY